MSTPAPEILLNIEENIKIGQNECDLFMVDQLHDFLDQGYLLKNNDLDFKIIVNGLTTLFVEPSIKGSDYNGSNIKKFIHQKHEDFLKKISIEHSRCFLKNPEIKVNKEINTNSSDKIITNMNNTELYKYIYKNESDPIKVELYKPWSDDNSKEIYPMTESLEWDCLLNSDMNYNPYINKYGQYYDFFHIEKYKELYEKEVNNISERINKKLIINPDLLKIFKLGGMSDTSNFYSIDAIKSKSSSLQGILTYIRKHDYLNNIKLKHVELITPPIKFDRSSANIYKPSSLDNEGWPKHLKPINTESKFIPNFFKKEGLFTCKFNENVPSIEQKVSVNQATHITQEISEDLEKKIKNEYSNFLKDGTYNELSDNTKIDLIVERIRLLLKDEIKNIIKILDVDISEYEDKEIKLDIRDGLVHKLFPVFLKIEDEDEYNTPLRYSNLFKKECDKADNKSLGALLKAIKKFDFTRQVESSEQWSINGYPYNNNQINVDNSFILNHILNSLESKKDFTVDQTIKYSNNNITLEWTETNPSQANGANLFREMLIILGYLYNISEDDSSEDDSESDSQSDSESDSQSDSQSQSQSESEYSSLDILLEKNRKEKKGKRINKFKQEDFAEELNNIYKLIDSNELNIPDDEKDEKKNKIKELCEDYYLNENVKRIADNLIDNNSNYSNDKKKEIINVSLILPIFTKTTSDYMQLVYLKHLNDNYNTNQIGLNNKYWAVTFDGMCAIIALNMGCPVLYEKADEVKTGLLVGLSNKIDVSQDELDLTEIYKDKFMRYINSDQNKNEVIAINKIYDFYSSTLYPSQTLLTLKKEKNAYFFKQRSENIELIKKDLKDSIQNRLVDKILTNLGDNDTTSYKNRYNNMYLKEIELNNYYEKLYKIKSLLNEIVIHRKNYLKNKLELCDRSGYLPAIYKSSGEIRGDSLKRIGNKFSNNLKEKYNVFKDDALFKDIRSLTKKIYNKIQEMEYNLTPYEVMLNNSDNWDDRKCGDKSKEISNSIKEKTSLNYVNKFEDISNKEEEEETPTRFNNHQGPTSPVQGPTSPVQGPTSPEIRYDPFAVASSPYVSRRLTQQLSQEVVQGRTKRQKREDTTGGRKKTLKLKRNKHKTRRRRIVNKRTRKHFRIKHKTRRNK